MVKRHPAPPQALVGRGELAPEKAARGRAETELLVDDNVCEARERVAELGDHVATIEVLTAVPVAVEGQQNLRLDLRETVDDRATPNSGGAADQIAPSDAHARNAATVSGVLVRYAATRSPGPTPRRRSPAATRAVSFSSRSQVQASISACSLENWIANSPGSRSRNTCSA